MTGKYVRASEARKRERGLREIRVWVPDTTEAVSAVRTLAASLCPTADTASQETDQKSEDHQGF